MIYHSFVERREFPWFTTDLSTVLKEYNGQRSQTLRRAKTRGLAGHFVLIGAFTFGRISVNQIGRKPPKPIRRLPKSADLKHGGNHQSMTRSNPPKARNEQFSVFHNDKTLNRKIPPVETIKQQSEPCTKTPEKKT